MANIFHRIKSFDGSQEQVLEISVNANSRSEAENLDYSDFLIMLYLDGKYVADLTPLIQETGLYHSLIDSVNWVELFCDLKAEVDHV